MPISKTMTQEEVNKYMEEIGAPGASLGIYNINDVLMMEAMENGYLRLDYYEEEFVSEK